MVGNFFFQSVFQFPHVIFFKKSRVFRVSGATNFAKPEAKVAAKLPYLPLLGPITVDK